MRAQTFCSRECAFAFRKAEHHHAWKGDRASYSAIHKYATKHFGRPKLCVNCNSTGTRMEWANLSRKYLRTREDWVELCASCHRHFDKADDSKRSQFVARWENYSGQKAKLLTQSSDNTATVSNG